jgi:Fe2+ transport system protein FeoA
MISNFIHQPGQEFRKPIPSHNKSTPAAMELSSPHAKPSLKFGRLSELQSDQPGWIVSLNIQDGRCLRHLADLGIKLSASVRIIQAYTDKVILWVNYREAAIDRELAASIWVRVA